MIVARITKNSREGGKSTAPSPARMSTTTRSRLAVSSLTVLILPTYSPMAQMKNSMLWLLMLAVAIAVAADQNINLMVAHGDAKTSGRDSTESIAPVVFPDP